MVEDSSINEYNNHNIKRENSEVISNFNKDPGLKDLPGIGDATSIKLKEAGIVSIKQLAMAPLSQIMKDAGLGEITAAKIVLAAREIEKTGFERGRAVWAKRNFLRKLTTGSRELDDFLGGGLEPGALTEFYGEYRTCKTQLAHQLCVNVQLPYRDKGLEGGALYIDTDGSFRPERIIQMAIAKDLEYKEVLDNITYARAYNTDHQFSLIRGASEMIKERNIKLIVVDSLIHHFLNEFNEAGLTPVGEHLLNNQINDLIRLSECFNELVVMVTNQARVLPSIIYSNPISHTGGHTMAHGSTIRVFLRKGKGDKRIAKIVKAPHLSDDDEAVFLITDEGITDGYNINNY